MNRLLPVLTSTILGASGTLASAMNSYFNSTVDPQSADLSFSECTGDEVAECVSYGLSCSPQTYPSITLYIHDRNIERIATALIVGTQGHAPGTLKLGSQSPSVELDINSLELMSNDMDGGWSLEIALNGENIQESVTDANSHDASLFLAGETFPLAPGNAGGSNLKQFMSACAALKS